MSIVIFIVVIVALIVVHEFGHFVVAKLSGMRVDEFGLGYPPRALTLFKKGETEYTLNWLPFGGFVKIYGEDGTPETMSGRTTSRHEGGAFSDKNRFAQALVLVAGIGMNLLFAYVLITGALVAGTPRALADNEIAIAKNAELTVAHVLPASPAERAGIIAGDVIVVKDMSPDTKSFTEFVKTSYGSPVTLSVKRNGEQRTLVATAEKGLVASDPSRYALGVEMVTVGVVPVSFLNALTEGASLTWGATKLTAIGLAHFFYGILTFSADLSQVSGPVGIAGVVGSASSQGIGNLLSIMAIISINLALINLIPIPALDGGRLLFVIIEGIIRRPINVSVARALNTTGFALLILLMVVVTAHDIFKIAS